MSSKVTKVSKSRARVNSLKFHTIQLSDPRVTIGYIPEPAEHGVAVKVAASWAHPRDEFNKKRGREIVAGRLVTQRSGKVRTIHLPLKMPVVAEDYRELESFIVENVMRPENFPLGVLAGDYRISSQQLGNLAIEYLISR